MVPCSGRCRRLTSGAGAAVFGRTAWTAMLIQRLASSLQARPARCAAVWRIPPFDEVTEFVKRVPAGSVFLAIGLEHDDYPRLVLPPGDRFFGYLDGLHASVDERRVGPRLICLGRQSRHLRKVHAAVQNVD